jgi:hypothetical protein
MVLCALASCVIWASLLYAGVVGVLLGNCRVDWRLAVTLAVVSVSPTLIFPAVELYWILVTQVLLVLGGVRLYKRAFGWEPNGTSQLQKSSRGRLVSLGALFFLTAFCAGLLVLIKNSPQFSLKVWLIIALIPAIATLVSLLAWITIRARSGWWWKVPTASLVVCTLSIPLVSLDLLLPTLCSPDGVWPEEIEFSMTTREPACYGWIGIMALLFTTLCLLLILVSHNSGKARHRVAYGAMVPVLGLLLWLVYLLGKASPLPSIEVPDNQYDKLVAIGQRLDASPFKDLYPRYLGWQFAPLSVLEDKLTYVADDLQTLEAILQRPIAVTIKKEIETTEFTSLREMARVLSGNGAVQLANGRADEAFKSFELILRLGVSCRHGGLMLHELVGIAITDAAAVHMSSYRWSASTSTRQHAVELIEKLLDDLDPLASVYAREERWMHTQGWLAKLRLLLGKMSGSEINEWRHMLDEPHRRNITNLRILMVELAVSSYVQDNMRYPDTLDVLVPQYLDAIPIDPYTTDGQPLGYFNRPDGNRVYSVGLDGVDVSSQGPK